MRKATFRMVAAGDGAPPSPAGYWYYLLAHAIATTLLLATLVVAVWHFMDWVVAPAPCPESVAHASVSSSATLAATEVTTAPVSAIPVYRATAALASDRGECDCPNSARSVRMPRDPVGPRPAQDAGTSGKRSPR